MAFDLVSTATITSSGVSQIDFSSIAQTGKDLFVIISSRMSATSRWDDIQLYINGVNTNQSSRTLVMDGASTPTGINSASFISRILTNAAGSSTNCFSSTHLTIFDYSSALNKNMLIQGVSADGSHNNSYVAVGNGRWAGTSAITSLSFRVPGYQYAVGTSISLYIIS